MPSFTHASIATAVSLVAAATLYLSRRKKKQVIYLDYNGTTPITVWREMRPYLVEHFGNPSSDHILGDEPRRAIDQARNEICQLLGTSDPSRIWFTSCGTEANHWAMAGATHVVTTNVEHPAILEYLKYHNIETTYVPVPPDGRVRASDVIAAIRVGHTDLVTIQHANNETGALQPIHEIYKYCRQKGVLFHTDAAQAAGKVPLLAADLVTVVGHKMGAPKGVACLYVRPGIEWNKRLLVGGGQEYGRRAGTENVASIVGFGAAARKAYENLEHNRRHMEAMRTRLLAKLQEGLGKDIVRANGPANSAHRLPNTLSVGLRGCHSGKLLTALREEVAASAGASCHSSADVSAVLKAMNVPFEFARGTIRLSCGPHTTREDIDRAAAQIIDEYQRQVRSG